MDEPVRRILVVDDEATYLRGLRAILTAKGYEVLTAQDGRSAIDLAARTGPDLILLDVRMPGLDGYATCRRIREFSTAPVIMLTALAETADKVKGLECGADDYVTKPFSPQELLARIVAVLRRAESAGSPEPEPSVRFGDLEINFAEQRVMVGADEVELTPTEYRLLCELARHAGQVLSSEHLLERVWGVGHEGEPRLVWRVIHDLRLKIERNPGAPHIETKAGSGYRLAND